MPGDGELIDSDACLSSEESEDCEVDADTELRDDTWEIAKELGILDPELKEVSAAMSASAQEKLDLRKLSRAMSKMAKGAMLQAEGFNMVQEVISRNPDLAPIVSVLKPYADVQAGSGLQAMKRESMPATPAGKPQIFQEGPVNAPVRSKDGVGWDCRYCGKYWVSYGGASSHTRTEHTKIFFGPCKWCTTFKSASQSSFNEHVRKCEKKHQSVVEEGEDN